MRALLAALAAVLALATSACNADLTANDNVNRTVITFTIQAYDEVTLDNVVPLLDVDIMIPGHDTISYRQMPAPVQFPVEALRYPQAAYNVHVAAVTTDPAPNVVLKCSWTAQTATGTRNSIRDGDSEGESGHGGPVFCRYHA